MSTAGYGHFINSTYPITYHTGDRSHIHWTFQLLPYIWSEAQRCVKHSQPVMRSMIFDWQHDPSAYTISDQFMLGEHLLFVPIVSEHNQRNVYLPEGGWLDYWTNSVYHGPRWLEVEAKLDELPIFIRAGAVVPLADIIQHTGAFDWQHLTLDICPGGENRFVVMPPHKEPVVVICRQVPEQLVVTIELGAMRYTLRLRAIGQPKQVSVDGKHAAWTEDNDTIEVSVPSSEGPCTIIVEYT